MQKKAQSSNKLSKTELISYYVDHGFIPIPLVGKACYDPSWPKTQYDPFFDPNTIPGNYGLCLQPDDLIIDIDKRNYKDGINSYHELCKAIGIKKLSENTFVVKTGSGQGHHIYLKKPPDIEISKTLPQFPGIEFLSKGQLIVGPGSIHPDTNLRYEIAQGTLKLIQPAPESLLVLITKKAQAIMTGIDNFTEDTQTVARYMEYCSIHAPLAIIGEHGDDTTLRVAYHGRDLGLSPRSVHEIMMECYNPRLPEKSKWDEKELAMKVRNAYRYAKNAMGNQHPEADFEPVAESKGQAFDVGKGNMKLKTMRNCAISLQYEPYGTAHLLAYNAFSHNIEFLRRAPWHSPLDKQAFWEDKDTINCQFYLASLPHLKSDRLEYPKGIVRDAALQAASSNPYHPLKNYLNSLKWDEVERLDNWLLTYGQAVGERDYIRAVGAKFLIAAVGRIYEPGVKFDNMLILEGAQGIGKSTIVKILGGPFSGELAYSDLASKDVLDFIRTKWIIEVPELQAFNRSEIRTIKNFLSRQEDSVRLAYAQFTKDFPRQCVFIGTHNPEDDNGYLKDPTGARRFWPVELTRINLGRIMADRDQLWAEAVVRYKNGEKFYLDNSRIVQLAAKEQGARRPIDPWVEIIRQWLDSGDYGEDYGVVTGADIFVNCIGGPPRGFGRVEQIRIATIMGSELGWDKGTFYDPIRKRNVRGFRRPKIKDEIDVDKLIQ